MTTARTEDDPQDLVERQRVHIELLSLLAAATSEMSVAATPTDVAAVTLRAGLRALGADSGYVALRDVERDDVLRVTSYEGYEPAGEVHELEVPLDADLPIATAARTGRALFVADNEALRCEHPGLRRLDAADHACASIPLLDGRETLLGAINIRFDQAREFTRSDRALLELLGSRCASAIVRARLYVTERARRLDAEHALATARALDINDEVVQLLTEAKLAGELGLSDQSADALARALDASKRIVAAMVRDAEHYRRADIELTLPQ